MTEFTLEELKDIALSLEIHSNECDTMKKYEELLKLKEKVEAIIEWKEKK